jgi:hypothetical protein
MYTENKLKEGTKEQENFNVKVVTTRSSIVKERANESTRSDTGENENFIETFLIQRQLTDHNFILYQWYFCRILLKVFFKPR